MFLRFGRRDSGLLPEKLEIRESYRRQFVGNVAHELKTPIFNIQGYIDTLLDGDLKKIEKCLKKNFIFKNINYSSFSKYILLNINYFSKLKSSDFEDLKFDFCSNK